jgi:starch synthase (maltosyl-transferring)
MKPLYIYNLFPKLYKNVAEWEKNIDKIAEMGFNTIYLNPIHYPGFSGSLYAPKDYYKYHPDFFAKNKPESEQLKSFIDKCSAKNISVVIDLVINHTSIDSVLIEKHKNWYVLENNEIKRPGAWENGKYIVWGDLAELDMENSPDKKNLWNYMLDLCYYLLDLGFNGFRCDAAYQLPDEFWAFLIAKIKIKYKNTLFLAETLGCTPTQIQKLSSCGFDYIFNSSKWWNFNDSWCLEQYSMTRTIAPSISFPESHDTERLMTESNGDINKFLQRLYFEAIFSKGFMISSGCEYGFKKRINVVQSTPADWEKTGLDFSKQIKSILTIKNKLLPLHEESPFKIVDQPNWMNIFCFIKEWDDQKVFVAMNKNCIAPQRLKVTDLSTLLNNKKVKDFSPEERITKNIKDLDIEMKPGEIKIFAPEECWAKD